MSPTKTSNYPVLQRIASAVWNFLAGLGFVVAFFGLVWIAERPSAATLPAVVNPQPEPRKVKKQKPSKIPEAPKIKPPEFK